LPPAADRAGARSPCAAPVMRAHANASGHADCAAILLAGRDTPVTRPGTMRHHCLTGSA
jgi:hypothetical protein